MDNSTQKNLTTALQAALEAGEAIMQVYDGHFHTEEKADGSPITIADKRANEIICRHLSGSAWPIISEENKLAAYAERKNWDCFWLVDPLDGTKEFISRNGEFTVNIALIQGGLPVLGVIVAPALSKAWLGTAGMPPKVLKNLKTPPGGFNSDMLDRMIADADTMQGLPHGEIIHVGVSRSHLDEKTEALVNKMKAHFGKVFMHPKGSSLKFCDLAAGDSACYPRYTPCYEWDTAAGHAILRAAGGEVYNLKTMQPLQYNKEDLRTPPFIAFSSKKDSAHYFAEFTF